jgi:hypothetical protein
MHRLSGFFVIAVVAFINPPEALGQGHMIFTPCCATLPSGQAIPPRTIFTSPSVPKLPQSTSTRAYNATPSSSPPTQGRARSSPQLPSVMNNRAIPAKDPCTAEDKKRYRNIVKKACGQDGRCTSKDSAEEISRKIGNNSRCIDARRIETKQCYSHNPEHDVIPIEQREEAIENCKKAEEL